MLPQSTVLEVIDLPKVELQAKKEAVVVSSVQGCVDAKNSVACVKQLISKYSKKYGVDKKLALDIAACESSFRANVYGDGGRAFGTFQFHRPTFEAFAQKMGEKLDYFNNEDNIKLAMWALANDKESHWSCYEKVAMN